MRYHIIVFLLFYIPIFSQQDPSLWGSDPKKLKGAKIILNSEKSPDNSSNFYIDLPILKRYGSRYFNSKKKGTTLSFKANNSALLGKEYEILNVLKNKEIGWVSARKCDDIYESIPYISDIFRGHAISDNSDNTNTVDIQYHRYDINSLSSSNRSLYKLLYLSRSAWFISGTAHIWPTF